MLRSLLCCLSVLAILASVSAIKTLKDIKDLKKNVHFVKEFPHHGLMLLHWLASVVETDGKGAIQFGFDPGQGNYGFHRCRNEIPNPQTPFQPESYFSLGDLSLGRARMLPFYVTQDFHNSKGSQHGNMDRVLIKVWDKSPQRVERVYLTQNSQGTAFDPNNTYEISAQLLAQIQALGKEMECDANNPRLEFRKCEFLYYQQKAAKLEMVYPKTSGLAWFLALAGYNTERRFAAFSTVFCSTNNPNDDCSPHLMDDDDDDDSQCYAHYKTKLEVKSTSTGYARITWSGIPESIARMEVNVGLYRDGTKEEPLKVYPLHQRTFGSIDTDVPLNPGLQPRLVRGEKTLYTFFFSDLHYTSVWNGPEFDEANGGLPTRVKGYDMSLQLYTKDGYACARLYIKKSFANWKSVFDNSWVGLYTGSSDNNNSYSKYGWVVNFEKGSGEDCPLDYDIYEYESSLDIGPGVQARLMLTKHPASEKARTVPWEKNSVFQQ